VAPTTSRLTATSAKSAWTICTRPVAVSAPTRIVPSIAPHVPSPPTRRDAAAAPACRKRRAAQKRKGKTRNGYRQAPARKTIALTAAREASRRRPSRRRALVGRERRDAKSTSRAGATMSTPIASPSHHRSQADPNESSRAPAIVTTVTPFVALTAVLASAPPTTRARTARTRSSAMLKPSARTR
jgi:hypothetical protein